jgi:hypothetical protein
MTPSLLCRLGLHRMHTITYPYLTDGQHGQPVLGIRSVTHCVGCPKGSKS